MKFYDEVVEKGGDLFIDLGKTAVIAGFAGLFVERLCRLWFQLVPFLRV